jgi:hypothetical protein
MLLQRIKPTRNAEAGNFIITQSNGNVKVSRDFQMDANLQAGDRLDVTRAGKNLFLLVESDSESAEGFKFVSTGHFNSKTVVDTLGGQGKKFEIDLESGFEPENMEGVTAYTLAEIATEEEDAQEEER